MFDTQKRPDREDFDEANKYLEGSIIINQFVTKAYYEGGLIIIFSKNDELGIVAYGYNNLEEWIHYLRVGNNIIKYDDYNYKSEKRYFDSLYREYSNEK